jgi:uncharacterized protein (TIGR00255 family)
MSSLRSMTGFGRGVAQVGARRLVVEVRSLNGRGIDIKIRGRDFDLPPIVEIEMVSVLRTRLARGTVSVLVRDEGGESGPASIDLVGIRRAHEILEGLRRDLGLAQPVDLATVAAFLAGPAAGHARREELSWEGVKPALEQAVIELLAMRTREGAVLAVDLNQRLDRLRVVAATIGTSATGMPTRAARKLQERLAAVLPGSAPIEPERLAQEVALLAERLDVSEELVRLRTHLDHMGTLLAGSSPETPGRKIDFLVQEIGRELNTIGSKVQDAAMAALVVDGKAELEKLREQAQNIE